MHVNRGGNTTADNDMCTGPIAWCRQMVCYTRKGVEWKECRQHRRRQINVFYAKCQCVHNYIRLH